MCGFLGEFHFEKSIVSDLGKFEELLFLSNHRGPDSSCVHIGPNYLLGFNRLAILDLSTAGDQPVKSPEGRFHLVFNGEIYNYKELIIEYKLNHLRSSSDTEIILHLLDLIGIEGTVKKLNGMFSLGIVDIKDNSLYLIRDFAGIKPLFYGLHRSGIVFASQFDQIFRHDWFRQNLNLRPEIMKEYFGIGYMQAPNTIYNNIHQVKPGEIIKVNLKGKVFKSCYYELPRRPSTKNFEDESAVEEFQTTFSDILRRQLQSDRPVGTFLSGGIDSPLILAKAMETKSDISAFTLKVDDARFDESAIAEKYAQYLNVSHYVVTINENDLLQTIDKHFDGLPEPFGDYSSVPTYLVTKMAKENFTVMLSGDGGDELFWGYPRMQDVITKRNWFKIPFLIRRPLNRLTNKLNFSRTHAPYYFKTLNEFILNKQFKIGKDRLNEIFPGSQISPELEEIYSRFSSMNRSELLQDLKWTEFYAHMQRVLIKVDRTSMHNSLEVRVPFLDKASIELSLSIKPGLGINHENPKKVLKGAMAELFPENLILNKKRGFSVPIEEWLRGPLKEDLRKTVLDSPLYGEEHFNQKALRIYVQDFLDEKINSGWGVWHIYAWQKWAEKKVIPYISE